MVCCIIIVKTDSGGHGYICGLHDSDVDFARLASRFAKYDKNIVGGGYGIPNERCEEVEDICVGLIKRLDSGEEFDVNKELERLVGTKQF